MKACDSDKYVDLEVAGVVVIDEAAKRPWTSIESPWNDVEAKFVELKGAFRSRVSEVSEPLEFHSARY